MANDFSDNPNCVALWRFEPAGLTTDSRGSNTLNASASAPTSNTTDYLEGSGSVRFTLANTQYYYIDDANLSSGFPWKNGDTNKKMTLCIRCRPYQNIYQRIISKISGNSGWALDTYAGYFRWVTGNGTTWTATNVGFISFNHWYTIVIQTDGGNVSYVKIWNETTNTSLYNSSFTPANPPVVAAGTLYIGSTNATTDLYDGLLDEIVVFNEFLFSNEIDAIRAQTYKYYDFNNKFGDDTSCKALWRFEAGALTTDSKGSNTLTLSATPPTAHATTYWEGAFSAAFVRASSEYAYIANASLDSGFPLKSDDTTKQVTFAFWIRFTTVATSGQYHQILCKSLSGSDNGLEVQLAYSSGAKFRIVWGYTETTQTTWDVFTPVTARWYHIAIIIDGVNKTWKCRVYDNTATTTTNYTGTTPASELRVNSRTLYIGCYDTIANYLDGYLDEFVVFNRLLIDAEVDAIRNRIFATNESIPTPLLSTSYTLYEPNHAGGDEPGILFMCGFEVEDAVLGWDAYSFGTSDGRSLARYRSGQFSLLFTNASYLRKNIHPFPELYLQVAICWTGATPAASAGKYLRWFKGATVLGTLNVNASGNITVYTGDASSLKATGTTVLEINKWYVIELHLNISDSGTFAVRIDGQSEFTWEGDTQPGTDTEVDMVELCSPVTTDVYYDDFFIISASGVSNNTWADRARIGYLPPMSDVTKSWSSSYFNTPDTHHFYDLRDFPNPDRGSLLYTKTAGLSEMYNMADCPLAANKDIIAVQAIGQFLNPTSTVGTNAELFVKNGSTVYSSIPLYVPPEVPYTTTLTLMKPYTYTWELNPLTRVEWTAAEIDNLILGFKKLG